MTQIISNDHAGRNGNVAGNASFATRAQALKALTFAQASPQAEWQDVHLALICHALTHFFRQLPKIAHTRALLETLIGLTKGVDEPLRLFHRDIAAAAYPDLPVKTGVRKVRRHLADIAAFQEAQGIELLVYVPGYKSGDGPDAEMVPSVFRLPLMWQLTDFLNTSQVAESGDAFAAVEQYTDSLIAKLRNKPAPHRRYTRAQDFDSCVKTAVGWGKRAAAKAPATCADGVLMDDAAHAAMLRRAADEIARRMYADAANLDGSPIWFRGAVDLGGVTDDRGGVSPVTPEDSDNDGNVLLNNTWVTSDSGDSNDAPIIPACDPEPVAHTFGQSLPEFAAQLESQQQAARLAEWREKYEASYSLADVEACNSRKPTGNGQQKQYRNCPSCGGTKSGKGRFNVHHSTGLYNCKACGVKGKLREFWEHPPTEWNAAARPTISRAEDAAKRQAQAAEKRAEDAAKIEAARKLYDAAKPLAQAPDAREYVQRRTGAADVAERCGARAGHHYGRRVVVFPVTNQHGDVVAITDRRTKSNEQPTCTTGPKSSGVFVTPGALDAERVVIVESPLDALAVAACGFDAIATIGTSWPEWLPDALAGKDVLLGFDNDQPDKHGKRAGDEAATRLAGELIGRAYVQRLRPSRKDWAEIAERDGLDALREEITAALFDAGAFDDGGEYAH